MHLFVRAAHDVVVAALRAQGWEDGWVAPRDADGWTGADVVALAAGDATGGDDAVGVLSRLEVVLPTPWVAVLDEDDDDLAPGVAALLAIRSGAPAPPLLLAWRRDRWAGRATATADTAPAAEALAALGMVPRPGADPDVPRTVTGALIDRLAEQRHLPATEREPDRYVHVLRGDPRAVQELARRSSDTVMLLQTDTRTVVAVTDPEHGTPTGSTRASFAAGLRELEGTADLFLARREGAPAEQRATSWALSSPGVPDGEEPYGSWDVRWTHLERPRDTDADADALAAAFGEQVHRAGVASAIGADADDVDAPRRLLEQLGLPVIALDALTDGDAFRSVAGRHPGTGRSQNHRDEPRGRRTTTPSPSPRQVRRSWLLLVVALVMVALVVRLVVADELGDTLRALPAALGVTAVVVLVLIGVAMLRARSRR